MSTDRISPTAHYTGYVWYRNGLGDPALITREGQLMFAAMRPFDLASRALFGSALEPTLLTRHRVIDHLLDRAIAAGEVEQVVEVAAGLSPRGLRMLARHGSRLRYLEADLPAMAARKRARLARCAGARPEVVELDALAEHGPRALDAVLARLDPSRGVAIITEGLINYFDRDAVEAMWRRFAAALGRFPHGLYLSDLHVAAEIERVRGARAFGRALSWFARGAVHYHFAGTEAAQAALVAAGFAGAEIHLAGEFAAELGVASPAASAFVRVIEARRA